MSHHISYNYTGRLSGHECNLNSAHWCTLFTTKDLHRISHTLYRLLRQSDSFTRCGLRSSATNGLCRAADAFQVWREGLRVWHHNMAKVGLLRVSQIFPPREKLFPCKTITLKFMLPAAAATTTCVPYTSSRVKKIPWNFTVVTGCELLTRDVFAIANCLVACFLAF